MTETSSFQLLEGGILPHLLLPCANILALASPPFKGRGLLWSSLIAYLAYLSLVEDYPIDTGMRYGLTNLWFFYLPTIEKLLFSQPEQAYWHLDRQKAEATSMPFGFRKLKWAAALWINPRGIGWNHQLKSVRPAVYSNSRRNFVAQQLFQSLLYYVVLASTSIYIVRCPHLGYRDSSAWTRSLLTELTTGIFIAFAWQFQWTIASITGVVSGLSQPKDWPPLFGRLGEVTTVRCFWGLFWHQILRQSLAGFSHALINCLGIQRGSYLSYLIYLSVGFFISGLFHAITLNHLASSPPSYDVFAGILLFFMSQVIAICVEELIIACYKHFTGEIAEDVNGKPRSEGTTWTRLAGYAWVVAWILCSGQWAADVYLRTDMWKVPMPLLEL